MCNMCDTNKPTIRTRIRSKFDCECYFNKYSLPLMPFWTPCNKKYANGDFLCDEQLNCKSSLHATTIIFNRDTGIITLLDETSTVNMEKFKFCPWCGEKLNN